MMMNVLNLMIVENTDHLVPDGIVKMITPHMIITRRKTVIAHRSKKRMEAIEK
jgi:hypothetical protein